MLISVLKGVGFGLTSGIITTLGLLTGLVFLNVELSVVIGGILTIAIADAFSDALGIHISEESGSKKTKESAIWKSTFATFFTKLVIALSFLIPVLLFNLQLAWIISIIYGLFLIAIFSYYIAKKNSNSVSHSITEHLTIAIFVIALTSLVGKVISYFFN